jgi:Zn-dependent M28 family amino/carboxypeptidase
MNKKTTALSLGTVAALAGATMAAPSNAAVGTDTQALRDAVTVEGVRAHQQALQDIADANGGIRASGTPGYDESLAYVESQLDAAGYTTRRQPFDYQFFVVDSPPVIDPVSPDEPAYPQDEVDVMEYSAAGDVEAMATPVDVVIPAADAANTSTSGCEAEDFAGFPVGNIALIQRGSCSFRQKADNAAAAGAGAAVIFNEGQEGRTDVIGGTLSEPQAAIPVLDTSYDNGAEMVAWAESTTGLVLNVVADVHVEERTTENLIADSPGGRTDRTVMAGAHLDSVDEGPGINDNGSGTAGILEVAIQMASTETRNATRFAFWGAEESGLIGSQFYVDSLSAREKKDIAAYLNFDMIGSPNFVRFVYDGDGSAFGVKGPNGSAHIEDTFVDFFASQDLESEPTQFDGRSDYDAFVAAGIPAGGLFTGAEGVKTPEQEEVYGGVAGESYDPCYHQACDTYDNVSLEGLDQMSDAVAHAVLTYAMTTSNVNGTDKASSKAQKPGETEFRGSHRVR